QGMADPSFRPHRSCQIDPTPPAIELTEEPRQGPGRFFELEPESRGLLLEEKPKTLRLEWRGLGPWRHEPRLSRWPRASRRGSGKPLPRCAACASNTSRRLRARDPRGPRSRTPPGSGGIPAALTARPFLSRGGCSLRIGCGSRRCSSLRGSVRRGSEERSRACQLSLTPCVAIV